MKKNLNKGIQSGSCFKKLFIELRIVILIIIAGVLNVMAAPTSPDMGNTKPDNVVSLVDQQITVSGTITDGTTGEPMPGVNIQVKGTTIGAIADINGKFSIPSADLNATLIFSFVGYITQEIPVAGKTVVNVALAAELTGLEEVVVIGYGSQKKETLTGAVSNIKATEIMTTKSTSVASSIQGKIPGVQIRQRSAEPGTYSSLISIRGFGAPLLVIDGVVRDGMSDFERLNSDDIESISVLKDASAAIYGMNADNGVLIVTTKKGFAGSRVDYPIFRGSSLFSCYRFSRHF